MIFFILRILVSAKRKDDKDFIYLEMQLIDMQPKNLTTMNVDGKLFKFLK